MKNITKKTVLAIVLASTFSANASAQVNAYSFDEATKDAILYIEHKKGEFNPYWFQDAENKNLKTYAYEPASADTPLHREYKEGDFNPYGFQN